MSQLVALVTGSSRGIGESIVEEFAKAFNFDNIDSIKFKPTYILDCCDGFAVAVNDKIYNLEDDY